MSIAMSATEQSTPNGTGQREYFASNGRLRTDGLSQTDRHYAMLIHLSPLAVFVFPIAYLAPLVLWLVRKDQSTFIDDHGKEVVNFLISFVVLTILLILAILTVVGAILTLVGIPTLLIAGFVGMIRGAMAAHRGEYFRYPMTIRFLT